MDTLPVCGLLRVRQQLRVQGLAHGPQPEPLCNAAEPSPTNGCRMHWSLTVSVVHAGHCACSRAAGPRTG